MSKILAKNKSKVNDLKNILTCHFIRYKGYLIIIKQFICRSDRALDRSDRQIHSKRHNLNYSIYDVFDRKSKIDKK